MNNLSKKQLKQLDLSVKKQNEFFDDPTVNNTLSVLRTGTALGSWYTAYKNSKKAKEYKEKRDKLRKEIDSLNNKLNEKIEKVFNMKMDLANMDNLPKKKTYNFIKEMNREAVEAKKIQKQLRDYNSNLTDTIYLLKKHRKRAGIGAILGALTTIGVVNDIIDRLENRKGNK